MKRISLIATLVVGSAFATGCASLLSDATHAGVDDNVVVEKTAKYFGVTREAISLSSVEKRAISTSYQAMTSGRIFNCRLAYGQVSCAELGAQEPELGVAAQASFAEEQGDRRQVLMSPMPAQIRLNSMSFR